MFLRIRQAGMVTLLGVGATLAFFGAAFAAPTVMLYPPMGTWTSHGYPSGSVLCMAWNHSIVTQATRLADGPLSLHVS
jgi:hypothetical protein